MKRPQFSLRDLIWLVLLCSMAAGWFADHKVQKKRADDIEAKLFDERSQRIMETASRGRLESQLEWAENDLRQRQNNPFGSGMVTLR
jgi:hypothetical protein